jgi:hypothetical protein
MFRGTLSSKILKFLLSPVRFTKCLGVRVPLRPPRKKALVLINLNFCILHPLRWSHGWSKHVEHYVYKLISIYFCTFVGTIIVCIR